MSTDQLSLYYNNAQKDQTGYTAFHQHFGSDITSASFSFNWSRGCGATQTRAARRYATAQTRNKHWIFMWHHYQSAGEMSCMLLIVASALFICHQLKNTKANVLFRIPIHSNVCQLASYNVHGFWVLQMSIGCWKWIFLDSRLIHTLLLQYLCTLWHCYEVNMKFVESKMLFNLLYIIPDINCWMSL